MIVRATNEASVRVEGVPDNSAGGGDGRIGSEAITIRYGAVNPTQMGMSLAWRLAVLPPGAAVNASSREPKHPLRGRFDMLLDAPPVGVPSMPIWLTVTVFPSLASTICSSVRMPGMSIKFPAPS